MAIRDLLTHEADAPAGRHAASPARGPGQEQGLDRRTFVGAVGIVLLAQFAVCVYLVQRSYFFSEDFTFFELYRTTPTDYDFLTTPIFGHLVPGFLLVNKYFGILFGASWPVAAAVTVLVQLGGTIAFARMLQALRGRPTWLGVVLTAAFGLSVIGLNTAPWWAATLTMQITMVLAVSAWGCVARFWRTRRRRHLVSLFVAYAGSVAFFEKSLATSAYIGLFVLIVGLGTSSGLRERVRQAWALWPAWALIAAVSLVDLFIYARGTYLETAGEPASLGVTFQYLVRSYPEGVFTSLIGAVYPLSTLPGPESLTWVVATVVVLGVMAWTSARSSTARRVWAWYFLVTLFSQALVARGRLAVIDLDTVVHQLRYQGDAHYLFLVALAVAGPAALAGSAPRTRRTIAVIVAAATAAALPLWVQSVRSISENSPGRASQIYFAQLRGDQLPSGARFLDLPVAEWVVPFQMYPWNMAGRVYPLVRPGTEVTDDPVGAWWIRPDGTIGPVQMRDLTRAAPRRVCVEAGGGAQQILRSPVDLRPTADPTLFTFDYTSDGSSQVLVTLANGPQQMDLRGTAVPFAIVGSGTLTSVVAPGEWRTAMLTVVSGDPVCVRSVRLTTPYG